jgi:hypothetical protein
MVGELKEYTEGKRESQFRRKNGKNQSKILAEVGSVGILGNEKLSPINKNSKELKLSAVANGGESKLCVPFNYDDCCSVYYL